MRIVGLCGYARSGKDTAALGLVSRGWKRAAFADALKKDVFESLSRSYSAEHPWAVAPELPSERWLKDPERKEAMRPLLVEYGRAMRKISPAHWIARLEKTLDPYGAYVVTDVRYFNEVKWVYDHGGVVFLVDRPGVGPANDEEELSLAEIWDSQFKPEGQWFGGGNGGGLRFVDNAGTPEELQAAVLRMAHGFYGLPCGGENGTVVS